MIQVWAKAPKLGASAIQGTWGIPSSEIKINQGTIELYGENVEEIERSKDADAEIRRLISLRERTETVARHTKSETMTAKQMYGRRLFVKLLPQMPPITFSNIAWGTIVRQTITKANSRNSKNTTRMATRWRYSLPLK